ncbi:phage antirepressor KilAC domain-containing protein [Paenibacillus sp. TRM 82003]|nr:phage antirepressor KilAC domain-containing protein [Paenibacillus sp. TRM 82003]
MTNLVYINNGKPVTTSMIVAETFGKEHRRVMQDIRELECSHEFRLHHFVQSSYINGQNRQMPMALITFDGFMFLAMGYTGPVAAQLKEKYIAEFNRMRQQLEQPFQLPQTMPEALRMLAAEIEEKAKIEGEKKLLQERIEADRPKVIFAESMEISRDAITVADMARMLKQNGFDIGEVRFFKYLRENGYLIKTGSDWNMPTQRSMDLGLFEIKRGTRSGSDGTVKITRTPKVTGKGQQYFINHFKKRGEAV